MSKIEVWWRCDGCYDRFEKDELTFFNKLVIRAVEGINAAHTYQTRGYCEDCISEYHKDNLNATTGTPSSIYTDQPDA